MHQMAVHRWRLGNRRAALMGGSQLTRKTTVVGSEIGPHPTQTGLEQVSWLRNGFGGVCVGWEAPFQAFVEFRGLVAAMS